MIAAAERGVDLRVRDLHHGRALRVQLGEQLHDLAALVGVQVAGRLVGQDDRRIGDHGAGDRHQLLLSAGELVRIEVLLADDVEAVEDVADHALALGALDVAVGERQVDVLVDGQVVEQVIALEHEADVLLLQPQPVLAATARAPAGRAASTRRSSAESCMPRMWSSVLLPAPDGPMIDTKSPWAISAVTRRSTKVWLTPWR